MKQNYANLQGTLILEFHFYYRVYGTITILSNIKQSIFSKRSSTKSFHIVGPLTEILYLVLFSFNVDFEKFKVGEQIIIVQNRQSGQWSLRKTATHPDPNLENGPRVKLSPHPPLRLGFRYLYLGFGDNFPRTQLSQNQRTEMINLLETSTDNNRICFCMNSMHKYSNA